MASRQRHNSGTKEETASATERQPNKFLFFCHISKDETAKGGSQLSVLVPHFSFTFIRFPLLHCAHVVPTLQQCFLLSFGSSFCFLRVCSFSCSAWSLFSCGACLLLLRRDWRANFLHVTQLACSETQMKITRQSKAEWKSRKMRTWRRKDIKMNIEIIAKAASHKLPGSSSLNVNFLCPVCPSLFVQHVTFYLSDMLIWYTTIDLIQGRNHFPFFIQLWKSLVL